MKTKTQKFLTYFIAFISGIAILALAVNIGYAVNNFPGAMNTWEAGDVIEEGWANAIEARIGETGTTSRSSLTFQVNQLMGTTTLLELVTIGKDNSTTTVVGGFSAEVLHISTSTATSTFVSGIRLPSLHATATVYTPSLRISGIVSCTDALETNAAGDVVCGTDATGSFTYDAFTHPIATISATSTLFQFTGGFAAASSTFTGVLNASSTLSISPSSGTTLFQTSTSTGGAWVIDSNGLLSFATSSAYRHAVVIDNGSVVCAEENLTDAATVEINMIDSCQGRVTLGGDRAARLQNGKPGQVYRLFLSQDSTGGRDITSWSSSEGWQVLFGSSNNTATTTPTTSVKPGVTCLISFVVTRSTSTNIYWGTLESCTY